MQGDDVSGRGSVGAQAILQEQDGEQSVQPMPGCLAETWLSLQVVRLLCSLVPVTGLFLSFIKCMLSSFWCLVLG